MRKLVKVFLVGIMVCSMMACSKTAVEATTAEITTAEVTTAEATTAKATTAKVTTAATKMQENSFTISGTVTEASMNYIVILPEQGEQEIGFAIEDVKTDLAEGMQLGHDVTITYTGEIKDGNTSEVKVSLITDKKEGNEMVRPMNTAPINHGELEGFGMLQGTVVDGDISTDKIVLETDDGRSIAFHISDIGDIETAVEIKKGARIAIAYSGSIPDTELGEAKLLVMLDAKENWQLEKVSGITVGSAMSAFTVKTSEGEELSFLKGNYETGEHVIQHDSGDSITVIYITDIMGNHLPLHIAAN